VAAARWLPVVASVLVVEAETCRDGLLELAKLWMTRNSSSETGMILEDIRELSRHLQSSEIVHVKQIKKLMLPSYLKIKKSIITNRVSKLNFDFTIEFLTIKTSKQDLTLLYFDKLFYSYFLIKGICTVIVEQNK
jgi:hypothetical protein